MKTGSANTGENRGETRKVANWVGAIAVAVLVLYPLSIGPAALLAQHGLIDYQRGEAFYAPVIWIADNTETGGKILQWYLVEVWHFNPFFTK